MTDLGKKLAGKCSHEDSRLTCTDCGKTICSQCLVQCPVGFRCPSCVGGVKASVKSGKPMRVARTWAACASLGFGAGWLMPFIRVPYISCIICYFLGLFAGRWLAGIIDYSMMGDKVGKIIVTALLLGMALSPCILLPFAMVEMLREALTGQGVTIFEALTSIAGSFFCPVCFVVGVLRPTVWGERF